MSRLLILFLVSRSSKEIVLTVDRCCFAKHPLQIFRLADVLNEPMTQTEEKIEMRLNHLPSLSVVLLVKWFGSVLRWWRLKWELG